ncbi:MAG: serine/threonine-protein kinase PknK [Deltaproteobacteria bacterium]|nr:MAG: serine/threonine-protein kinase PknK [Deltaproteobacteria bacterium]
MKDTGDAEFGGTDRFAVRRRIGAGGMGIVYEAHDRERDAPVALKTLRRINAQGLYRLKQEFRALRDLQHPNLVSLGELVEDGGHWFFTMELVPGRDFLSYVRPRALASGSLWAAPVLPSALRDTVRDTADFARPAFDEDRLRDALGQLARGLRALHGAGKVHRDIKPNNIIVTDQGRVVLLDFGLALDTTDADDSTEQAVVGTVAYMAPEQAASKPVGPPADWYSVGVLLYEALTGEVPFDGAALSVMMEKQRTPPRPPSELVSGIPPDLERLCLDLLAFDPAARPDGDEVLRRLALPVGDDASPPARASSSLASPPFVGRARELDALRAAFERTRGGAGATVIVAGESGVGKTALIHHFTRSLTWEGEPVVVLRGRCYERESVPFKGLDGVVDALSRFLRRLPRSDAAGMLPRHASLLPQIFPVLGRVECIAGAPRPLQPIQDPRELRNRAFGALRELFCKLAERFPIVVVIDDLQWTDADSLLLLGDLVRPPDAPPLLLIASVRSEAAHVVDSIPGPVIRIHLDRLPPDEARALAEQLLARRNLDRRDAIDAIADEANGHPLFIDELVRHAADSTSGDSSISHLRLDEAILERVDRLDARSRRLLDLVCLAAAPISQAVLAQAAEVPGADASRDLATLRVANLVRAARASDRYEPYHDRIREAVSSVMADDRRRAYHARLALALEASDDPSRTPEVLVYHLEAAGRVADATAHAEEAARRASHGLAFERAAELYRTALRLGDYDADKRRKLLIALGEALANAGRGPESAEVNLQAAEGADPTTRLECQRRAAEQLLISGHIERGLDALERVLAEIGEKLPKTPARALASVLWSRARLRLRGLDFTERHESEIAAHVLTRIDVYKSVAHGLGVVDTIRGVDFQHRGLLLALQTGEPFRVGRALLEGGAYLAVQGGRAVKRGRELVHRAADIAERTGDPYLKALTAGVDGVASYYEGRLRPAYERLRTAETTFVEQTHGATWELNTVRLFRMFVLRRLGWWTEIAKCFDDYVRDAMRRGDNHMETSLRWSCNDVWLARGDVDQAKADLESKTWLPPEGRFHLQHFYALRARAEIALYTGEARGFRERMADQFRALRRSMLLRIHDVRAEVHFALARCALVDGDLRTAAKLARTLRDDGVSFAVAWGILVDAMVLAASGQSAKARRRLREAILFTEEVNMRLFNAVARRHLGRLIGGAEGDAHVAAADRVFADESIAEPERFAEVCCPFVAQSARGTA